METKKYLYDGREYIEECEDQSIQKAIGADKTVVRCKDFYGEVKPYERVALVEVPDSEFYYRKMMFWVEKVKDSCERLQDIKIDMIEYINECKNIALELAKGRK